MEENRTNVCRLCLKPCEDFETIEESHQEIFNTVLMIVDLAISHKPVVCKECIDHLQNCVTYKSVSLHMVDDLTSIKGCMFCHKSTLLDKFVPLNSDEVDVLLFKAMMVQFFPELDLSSILDPTICIQCYNSLQQNFEFMVGCLNVEQQIKTYCALVGPNAKGHVDLRHLVNVIIEEGAGSKIVNNTPQEEPVVEKIDTCEGASVLYFFIKKEENFEEIVQEEREYCKSETDQIQEIITEGDNEGEMKQTCDESDLNILCGTVKIEDNDGDEVVEAMSDTVETVVTRYDQIIERLTKYDQEINLEPDIELEEDSKIINDVTLPVFTSHRNKRKRQEYLPTSGLLEVATSSDSDEENYLLTQISPTNETNSLEVLRKTSLSSSAIRSRSSVKGYLHPIKCKYCKFETKYKKTFNNHINKCHGDDPLFLQNATEPYETSKLCKDVETKKADVNEVVDTVTAAIESVVRQYSAGDQETTRIKRMPRPKIQEFFSELELRDMITTTSVSGEKRYQCQVCQLIVKTKGSINRHMVLHQNPSEVQLFECPQCNFKTKRKSYLTIHVSTHNEDSPKPFQCKYCAYNTGGRRNLYRHITLSHEDRLEVNRYHCHICGYKTWLKILMKRHSVSHENEDCQVFRCDKCSYRTSKKSNMKRHKLKHSSSLYAIHKCKSCDFQSRYKKHVRRHQENHMEPMKCRYCQFESKYEQTIKKHVKKCHGEDALFETTT